MSKSELREAIDTLKAQRDFHERDARQQHAWVHRLEDEISRRDAVLDWLRANTPGALELCPFKIGAKAENSQPEPPA